MSYSNRKRKIQDDYKETVYNAYANGASFEDIARMGITKPQAIAMIVQYSKEKKLPSYQSLRLRRELKEKLYIPENITQKEPPNENCFAFPYRGENETPPRKSPDSILWEVFTLVKRALDEGKILRIEIKGE